MNTRLTVFALIATLFLGVGTSPALGQIIEPITVMTDKEAYSSGDIVMITGEVRESLSGFPVAVKIISANGNLVGVKQLDVKADRTYGTNITAGGGLWSTTGTYQIEATYGSGDRVANTTFEYSAEPRPVTPVEPEPPTPGEEQIIAVQGTEFSVEYSITGGSVKSIVVAEGTTSIIIEIETISDGELTITLPRGLIDAKDDDGMDREFIVTIDNEQRDFTPAGKTPTDRTLVIPFLEGDTEIEIIGTFVIPEFGTIAVLILAVAIIAIIAISSRSKIGIMMPKI